MIALHPRPIPEYPAMRCPEDWARFLRLSQAMLDRLTARQDEPDSEVFQAVVHLVQTLAPEHLRHLH
mgnify:CR=1 FL=1|jgi:hypothetical protein